MKRKFVQAQLTFSIQLDNVKTPPNDLIANEASRKKYKREIEILEEMVSYYKEFLLYAETNKIGMKQIHLTIQNDIDRAGALLSSVEVANIKPLL